MGFNTSKKDQLVFNNRKNEILPTSLVNKWLKTVISKIDLPNITPHHFRHTYTNLFLHSGIPVKEVSERLKA